MTHRVESAGLSWEALEKDGVALGEKASRQRRGRPGPNLLHR